MINYLFTKTPLVFFVQSFWRDEAFTYILSKQNLFNIVSLTIKDFNPPFYYFIIHFWMKIFGYSEISLRLFSFICYWGVSYVGFLFLSNVLKLSFRKSFFYLIFFIVNPLLIYYAFEARMYTLFTLLAGLSFYFFYQKKKLFYLIVTIAGFYTHYFMIFVVAGQFFYLFLNRQKIWLEQAKTIIISIISFLPWIILLLLNKSVFSQAFWLKKPNLLYAFHFFGILYTGHESDVYSPEVEIMKKIIFFLNLIFLVIVLIGVIKINGPNKKNVRPLFWLLAIWGLIIPLFIGLISFVKPLYLPRYLIFSTFGFLILLVFILDKLSKMTTAFFFTIIILLTIFYNKYQTTYRTKINLAKTIKEIKSLARQDDLLYVTSELDYFTAQYYFDENRVYIYKKSYQEIPNYVGKILISQEKLTQQLPSYPKKAFILKEDGTYVIQAMY